MNGEGSVALLFSGGKDSNYAFHILEKEGYDVCCLISVVPEDRHSMLLHAVNSIFVILQSEAMGRPLLLSVADRGDEEEILTALLEEAKEMYGASYLASGGVASRYQKGRFEDLAGNVGLKAISPLWMVDQERYIREVAMSGIRALITRVAALGLDEALLGRTIDVAMAEEVIALSRRYMFNPSFEGGEAETFVIDAPFYRKRIKILKAMKMWYGDWGELQITDAILEGK